MVDAAALAREFLLTLPTVTFLLGTNLNQSIYCSYDVPEHFNPKLGPIIQIFLSGGSSHPEILPLVNARVCLKVIADVERSTEAIAVYAAAQDGLHGTCNVALDEGYLMSALEITGPQEMTDPDTGWVAMQSFYAIKARPN